MIFCIFKIFDRINREEGKTEDEKNIYFDKFSSILELYKQDKKNYVIIHFIANLISAFSLTLLYESPFFQICLYFLVRCYLIKHLLNKPFIDSFANYKEIFIEIVIALNSLGFLFYNFKNVSAENQITFGWAQFFMYFAVIILNILFLFVKYFGSEENSKKYLV